MEGEEQKPLAQLVIVRGAPGSGKTTIAKTRYPGHLLVEADMFRYDKSGKYVFDKESSARAHRLCLETTLKALRDGRNVVVANTFIKLADMEPYVLAGYPFQIVEATGRFDNFHFVPKDVVDRMRENFSPVTQEWLDKIEARVKMAADNQGLERGA